MPDLFVIQLSNATDPLIAGDLIAPGVEGYAIWCERTERLFVPWVAAVNPGNGDVRRFVERCPPAVVFPTVVSARMERILEMAGFKPHEERDPYTGEQFSVWQRTQEEIDG